jgi:excisionase family DNA binding protein
MCDAAARLDALERKLDQLLERGPAVERRFFGVEDAAVYTSLSAESIRRLLATGRLTALRPRRGRVLIDRRELDALVLGSTRRPTGGRGSYERRESDL